MAISMPADEEDTTMSNINTTPLVDVMLVLLIIFLITIPVAIQTVKVQLPKVNNQPTTTKPENIIIGVDQDGAYYWNAWRIDGGREEMKNRIKQRVLIACPGGHCADIKNLPEVHMRADVNTNWSFIGAAIATAQSVGIQKVAFISEQDRPSSR